MNTAELLAASSTVLAIAVVLWVAHRIRYCVDAAHVRVMLGGLTLRKIPLADIERVDAAAPMWNEHWCNTLLARGRIVRLRRRSGLVRNFLITPAQRAQFLGELRAHLPAQVPVE